MNTETTYLKNDKRVAQARLSQFFGNKILVVILKGVTALGVVAYMMVLILGLLSPDGTESINPMLWLVIFVSLLAVGLLNFPAFLKKKELQGRIKPEADTNLGLSADFEATSLLSSLDFPSVDLGIFLKLLAASPEVKFVLAEMAPNDKFWDYFRAGMTGRDYFSRLLSSSVMKAQMHNSPLVSVTDLFWGALVENENFDKILSLLELEESDLSNIFFLESRLFALQKYPPTVTEKLRSHTSGIAQSWDSGYTQYLDRFSHTVLTSMGSGFSVEGREQIGVEIENILTKQSKNNIILTGTVGVGKTTIIKGLVSRISWGESLPALAYMRVVELDLGAIISHARDRAALEQVLIAVFNDAVRAGNIILYVQNVQNLFAGGSKEGTIDASEIILPYLRGSSLRLIGSTTGKSFETYIQAKPELASMFTNIVVNPTEKPETLRILAEISVYLGRQYGVKIAYRALKEVYLLAEKFVTEKEFPGKAVDILENVCNAAKNEGLDRLDRESVATLAEKDLNVKISAAAKDEKIILLKLEESMHSRVIGQFTAVKAVADALRRARANVTNTKRPVGSFLFLGPTGVGKTELAKTLAWAYYGNETDMIRMDMNEFQDQTAIDRFIGKKALGSEELEGGEFVKKVRSNPQAVILLDEIEKANPNILDLFLQAIDEGYITDGMGEKVVLSSAIIIATSNAGANLIRQLVGAGEAYSSIREKVLEEVQNKGLFKPEFLNRFDGVIVFSPLSGGEILQVAELMFSEIQADFKSKGYEIELGAGVLEKMAEEGYVPEMGARPMRRVFQDRLENYLAKKLLEDILQKGVVFTVQLADLYPPN